MTLAAVRDALLAEDFAAARDAAIAAWRERRSPELAALVETLAQRAPDALTAQLASVITPRVVSSHARLKALARVDDPRLATWALDALVNLPFTAASASPFLRAVVQTVERLRDIRLRAREPAILAAVQTRIGHMQPRQRLLDRVRRTARHLPEPRAATAAELALEAELARLVAPLQRTRRTADELLAEIYAHPDDDAPRTVYADVLGEAGDPRGELIALQLAGGEPTERERELLAKHGKKWLGNLAPVLSWGRGYSGTKFRRGFVAVADIILSVGKKLQPIVADPAWATVEELEGSWDRSLLEHAPLNALRRLDRYADRETIALLARRGRVLPAVRSVRLADLEVDPAELRAVLPHAATLAIYARATAARDLVRLAGFGFDHVQVTHNWYERADGFGEFAAYVASLVGAPAPLARLTLGAPYTRDMAEPPPVELRRTADGVFAVV